MRVLKKKDLFPIVAKENKIDQEIVESVVNFYWKEVITAIREFKHLNILLPEIGEMRFSRTKLESAMERIKNYMTHFPEDSERYKLAQRKLDRLAKLIEIRQAEYDKRENVRQKRDKYEKNKKNLEE